MLCVVSLNGVLLAPLESGENDRFCDNHDCPKFKIVIHQEQRGYDMKCFYEKQDWLGTNLTAVDSGNKSKYIFNGASRMRAGQGI